MTRSMTHHALRGSIPCAPLLLAACLWPGDSPAGATQLLPPPALQGEALDFVRARIAAFDGKDGPASMHVTGGSDWATGGVRVEYDRYLIVGSQLQADRGREFDAFVDGIAQRGGCYFPLYLRSDQRPGKILVLVDGKRVMVSVLQW